MVGHGNSEPFEVVFGFEFFNNDPYWGGPGMGTADDKVGCPAGITFSLLQGTVGGVLEDQLLIGHWRCSCQFGSHGGHV